MADIDLKVECDKCGTELEAEILIRNYELFLIAKPCSCCMDAAKEEGYERETGKVAEESYKDGFNNGKEEGYDKGHEDGYNEAKREADKK
jgi:flagellar biosynthesis/type III secretory pathway protein FliH